MPKTPTNEALKQKLTPEQYHVLVEKGTEAPYTGKYNTHFENGTYACAACGEVLFESGAKYDASCGWPAFNKAIHEQKVKRQTDTSHDMVRTEVLCSTCGSHLGHVFPDKNQITGDWFCINSAALNFKKHDA